MLKIAICGEIGHGLWFYQHSTEQYLGTSPNVPWNCGDNPWDTLLFPLQIQGNHLNGGVHGNIIT
jgi:hypothetical protein